MATKPLIAIVGETASGKTSLGIKLAESYNGEIICADSRTIYEFADIGTAKPNSQETRNIPHHMLDIIEPSQTFSAAEFKRFAQEHIKNIHQRGALPILVGGSGLYVDSVLFNYQFRAKPTEQLRQRLSRMTVEELQDEIIRESLPMPTNKLNKRHLQRTIETKGEQANNKHLRKNTLVIGLRREREAIARRIEYRAEQMFNTGLIEEARALAERFGWGAPGLQAPAYKALRQYFKGSLSLPEAKELFVTLDKQLAKRQRTWFKRNKHIHWVSDSEQATELVQKFLHKN